ncbi:isoprenylcysteine carboxylmethyltransferase family protein [Pseudomonas sp. ABC1]|uniref:methyltransferase family protein n=1 Tax=Pseudomonas sp. ABC1 TaxID=2748080 RepID=UPI0015C2FC36|nr:isoprenylcysteine carboxylmethyltransferase family protein [Pseudomonas sp. ABC1]QLF94287.1 isoprenylcysteine carboxylmethyltransferase family protein [Pseudomonas sp. ABC1]
MVFQVVAFVVLSALLVGVSWRALGNPRSHGFYRFLAWEVMLVLLVLNAPYWFEDRGALHQRISWVLLTLSLAVLFAGVYQMRRFGRATQGRQDDELFAFERTSRLVTSGIFRYIRHPLYCSLLLLAWGIAWKNLDGLTLGLALLASLLLLLTARRDEAECIDYFGEPYRDYMARSRMFIPFVF